MAVRAAPARDFGGTGRHPARRLAVQAQRNSRWQEDAHIDEAFRVIAAFPRISIALEAPVASANRCLLFISKTNRLTRRHLIGQMGSKRYVQLDR